MMAQSAIRAAIVPAMAVLVAAAMSVRAVWTRHEVEPAPLSVVQAPLAESTRNRPGPDNRELRSAIAANPFHPRRRKGGRFLPRAERPVQGPEPRRRSRFEATPVVVVGTAMVGNGDDFVVCGPGRAAPRIVRIGETCGELVLRSVGQGRAVFADKNGESVVIDVAKVGSR